MYDVLQISLDNRIFCIETLAEYLDRIFNTSTLQRVILMSQLYGVTYSCQGHQICLICELNAFLCLLTTSTLTKCLILYNNFHKIYLYRMFLQIVRCANIFEMLKNCAYKCQFSSTSYSSHKYFARLADRLKCSG